MVLRHKNEAKVRIFDCLNCLSYPDLFKYDMSVCLSVSLLLVICQTISNFGLISKRITKMKI